MKTLFMRAVYVLAAIPLLVVGQCTYRLVSEPIGLKSLCETAKAGNAILMFLDAAARTGFKARTGGPAEKTRMNGSIAHTCAGACGSNRQGTLQMTIPLRLPSPASVNTRVSLFTGMVQ